MLCITTREGQECTFMSAKGCSYVGGTCQPAVEACEGCDRAIAVGELAFCKSYPDPAAKWRQGNCNFATHIKGEAKVDAKINPLKASKRAHKK
jgi:hypothetical protein